MKPLITNVSYGRTVDIGEYESIRFDFTARVQEGENWQDVLDELKKEALKQEKFAKKNRF